MKSSQKIELLAPAGSPEAAIAAVRCGADAIYLGLPQLNARQNAQNFDADALQQTVQYCHLCGVKVYLTLNTIVFDTEIDALQDALLSACRAPVDAVIIQDLGTLLAVRKWCPDMPIHASTQMTVHTVSGVKLLQSLGVSRVVLARELSCDEIAVLTRKASQHQIETEVFVHGSLCMSVSGQCYMSAMLGTRSGNKGSCAGSCRLPFSMRTGENSYDLSLKDCCLAAQYQTLAFLGMTALKIEGRMKRPEYVAATVRAYAGLKQGISPDLSQLRRVFSRNGFTDGYFIGDRETNMFGTRTKQDVRSPSDPIYQQIRAYYRKEPARYPLHMHLRIQAEHPASLTISTADVSVHTTGSIPQAAHTRALDRQQVQRMLRKCGGSPFYAQEIVCDTDPGLTLPASALNALRRNAVEQLTQKLSHRPCISFDPRPIRITARKNTNCIKFYARFQHIDQIPFTCLDMLGYFSIPIAQLQQNIKRLKPYADKLIIELDRVMFDTEKIMIGALESVSQHGFYNVAASNLAHIQIAHDLSMNLFGTAFLNITNSLSVSVYEQLHLQQTELSFENKRQQLLQIQGGIPLGFIAYGYLPLMLVRNCPIKRHIHCNSCTGTSTLTDRKKQQFTVLCNQKKYSEILNSRPVWLADKLDEFLGMDYATLYFTTESQKDCADIIAAYQNRQAPPPTFTRGLYYRGIESFIR